MVLFQINPVTALGGGTTVLLVSLPRPPCLTMHPTGAPLVLPHVPRLSRPRTLKVGSGEGDLARVNLRLRGPRTPKMSGSGARSFVPVHLRRPASGLAAGSVACGETRVDLSLLPPAQLSLRRVIGDGHGRFPEIRLHVCSLSRRSSYRYSSCPLANSSTPPTPHMGRRKLELLPRSSSGSAAPSPLASPNPSTAGAKANPFGAAK